jgi:hypothetical protein
MARFMKRFARPSSRQDRRTVQPRLEQLEDRLTPSAALPSTGLLADAPGATGVHHDILPYLQGPLLHNVRIVTVFWGDAWQTDPVLEQQSQQLDAYFADITNSGYMDMLSEYHVGRGSFWMQVNTPLSQPVNADGTPGRVVTSDQDVQDMLTSNISDPNSPMPVPDANTLYMVFPAPNVQDPGYVDNNCTGYHSNVNGQPIYYGVVFYPGNASNPDDLYGLTYVSSHEMTEAVTDPDGTGWNNVGVAEVGDQAGDTLGQYHRYIVQAEWSNVQQTAVLPPDATWAAWSDMSVGPNNVLAVAHSLTHSSEYYADFVTAAYQRYLGRMPVASEVNGWVASMQRGLTDEQLEAGFIGSPEYIANHGGAGAGWVTGMYHDLLGRTPTNEEVNAWVNHLNQGETTQAVAYGFAASFERESQRVQADYQTFLGRAASDAEVANWATAFEQGMTNEDVVSGFVGSYEYFANHGSTLNDWLNAAYTDVLHRAIDDASLQMWDAALL